MTSGENGEVVIQLTDTQELELERRMYKNTNEDPQSQTVDQ